MCQCDCARRRWWLLAVLISALGDQGERKMDACEEGGDGVRLQASGFSLALSKVVKLAPS